MHEKKAQNLSLFFCGQDWNDGRALSALIDSLQPGHYPNHKELPVGDRDKHEHNCQDAIDRAYDCWEVPKLLDGSDMANPKVCVLLCRGLAQLQLSKVDQNSMMAYISYFRNLDPNTLAKSPPPKQPGDDAKDTKAYGSSCICSLYVLLVL